MFEPEEFIKARLERVDSITKFLKLIKLEDLDLYISNLKDMFNEIVGNYNFDTEAFNWRLIRKDFELLQNFPNLEKLIFLYICKTLRLPGSYASVQGEIELSFIDWFKALRRIPYYLVRTLADTYGKEKGIEIYKQIVPYYLKELKSKNENEKPEDPKSVKILDMNKKQTEAWCECGMADFALCIFDDYKVVYRFDSCLTHEVLKEFNDPDIAYLSSCYLSDHLEYNIGKIIRLRRVQTLHHAKFCDELYWNNYVHPDTEQPSLEFTKNIGKDLEE